MYRCNECGAEYKTKPQYCDCGNDSFEEIVTQKKEFVNPLKHYDINIYALLFFISCLILSALVILFLANPKPQNTEQMNYSSRSDLPIRQSSKIPDIETFWDNTPIKQVEQVEENVTPLPQPAPIIIKQIIKQQPSKPAVKQPAPKPVVKEQPKPVTKPAPKKIQVVNNKEVQNYKLRLRNALFYKLNCPAIQGSGKCGIQFAVNSQGKLINRAFIFQSDNTTLNDEVYKMLMRLPTFDAPPQGYNGELIKLSIEFNNGEYEILFIN